MFIIVYAFPISKLPPLQLWLDSTRRAPLRAVLTEEIDYSLLQALITPLVESQSAESALELVLLGCNERPYCNCMRRSA